MYVLLVDDDSEMLARLAPALEARGFVVDPCESASGALELLRTRTYDVLVSDLSMPEMRGSALAARALEIQPTLRVGFISGALESGEVVLNGVSFHYRKDEGLDALVRCLRGDTLQSTA